MKIKKNFIISLLLSVLVLGLLCVPELEEQTKEKKIKQNNSNLIEQSTAVDQGNKLAPEDELRQITDFQTNLNEQAINEAKIVNAKAYFQLRKLQGLSEKEIKEQAKLTQEERKAMAKLRVKNALIAHLQK